jgi:peptidoglycan hydrolase-like protein with peptidoglycan-binding domain
MTTIAKSNPTTTTTTTNRSEATAPTAAPEQKPSARQPDLDQKASANKLLGTDCRPAASLPPADPQLKADIDHIRRTGNTAPSAKAEPKWVQPFETKTRYEVKGGLDDVRGGSTLARGHSGPGVEDAQAKLNAALKGTGLPSLATDGLFGPKTQANLQAYQSSRGLPVTGIMDKATLAALDANQAATKGWKPTAAQAGEGSSGAAPTGVVSTVTATMSEAQKFDHYKAMIEKSGGTFNPNGPNIVGVRSATNTHAAGGAGRYDDAMAVIWHDKQGNPRVKEFRGNTEPSGNYDRRMGQDVNGDGSLDQGRLRTGHYSYSLSSYHGNAALRMNGDSRVDRDTNHDGTFGNDGGASSGGGASMLFHRGGVNSTGSAGCQTMPPAEFDRFMSTLQEAGLGGGNRKVGYTLVDAG